jgi:hypothetical protein
VAPSIRFHRQAITDYQRNNILVMALQIDRETVPGTEQLIDGMQAHSFWP